MKRLGTFEWALLAVALLPTALSAQSLMSAGGLGLPLDAVDARSRALGSFGVGLFGPAVLPLDPVAAADLIVPELTFSFKQSWVDLEGVGAETARGGEFPLIGLAYPIGWGVVTATFAGVLDQRWRTEVERVLDLGNELARVTDRFRSEGGVAAARLGLARRISSALSLGITVGTYTGDVTRTFTRRFDSLAIERNVPPFATGGLWGYSGPILGLGAQFDFGSIARVAGTVTWSGDLTAEPSDDTDGSREEFSIPMEYRFGASGALAPGLNLVMSLRYADWSGVDDGSLGGSGSLGYGVGLEWEDASFITDQAPLRFGYRKTDLPFGFQGEEAHETLWTAGLGLNLVQLNDIPLARLDFALERGIRSSASLTERFWQAMISVRVAGL